MNFEFDLVFSTKSRTKTICSVLMVFSEKQTSIFNYGLDMLKILINVQLLLPSNADYTLRLSTNPINSPLLLSCHAECEGL